MQPTKIEEQEVKKRRLNTQWGSLLHLVFNFALPIVILGLIRNDLNEVAILVVLLSKWRVFAVQPRFWLTNLRTNSTDLIVKLSTVTFMIQAETLTIQAAWTAWYIFWLIVLKPRSDLIGMSAQAMIGLFLGVSALFQFVDDISAVVFVTGIWVIAFSAARHYFSSYDDPLSRVMSYIWALFAAQLAWVMMHWVLAYLFVPQYAFIITIIGYSAGSIYHHYKQENLKRAYVRDQLALAGILLFILIIFGDWSGEI